MKKQFLHGIYALCCILLVTFAKGCNTADLELPDAGIDLQKQADYALIQKLGYDITDISENDECYILEGDILLEKNKLQDYLDAMPATRSYYYYGNNYILPSENRTIRISAEQSVPPEVRTALNAAVNAWNAIPNTTLYFHYIGTDVGNAHDVKVRVAKTEDNLSSGTWSASKIPDPATKKAGSEIQINTNCGVYSTITTGQWVTNMVHAIGHTIGFAHRVDNPVSTQITGATGSESDSFMYLGNNYFYAWQGFIPPDIKAIQLLYGFPDDDGGDEGGGNPGGINQGKILCNDEEIIAWNSVNLYLKSFAGNYMTRRNWYSISGKTGGVITTGRGDADLIFKCGGSHIVEVYSGGIGNNEWFFNCADVFKVEEGTITHNAREPYIAYVDYLFKLNYTGNLNLYENFKWWVNDMEITSCRNQTMAELELTNEGINTVKFTMNSKKTGREYIFTKTMDAILHGVISGPAELEKGGTTVFNFLGSNLPQYNWAVEGLDIVSGQGTNTLKVKVTTTGTNAVISMKKPGSTAILTRLSLRVYSKEILPAGYIEVKNGGTVTLTWNGPTSPSDTWTITPSPMEGGRAEIVRQMGTLLQARFFNTKTNVSGSFTITYRYNGQNYNKSVYIEQQTPKPPGGGGGTNPEDPDPGFPPVTEW